jgi:hypothetical protein
VELDADGAVVRRSEASPTPVNVSISNKAGVTVTQGTPPGEGETDWEVEAAADDSGAPGTWYRIATVDIATTTYSDASSTISTTNPSALTGAYIPPPSCKYIISDTNRLLMAGAWEAAASTGQTAVKQNRVWYTPVIGSTDEGDDERIPNTVDQQNWVDIGNEGPITALAGPLYGDIYVLKQDYVFKLTPTGDLETPYRVIQLSAGIGAVDQRTVAVGEMGNGTPALFFAAASSVYALSSQGVEEISDDIARDLRLNNFTAASSIVAFNPFDKALWVQTNSGSSALAGRYYQFAYDLKTKRWTGLSIGGGESSWILGRGLLGVDTILGGDGSTIRNAVVAQNDNSSVRLLLCGQDVNETSLLVSEGDVCGTDGGSALTTRFRVRKFPTPGHKFMVGCPTFIYRSPTGDDATGTLTVSYLDQGNTIVTSSATLTATDADNPVQQRVLTLDGMARDNLDALDVRVVWSYDAGFESSIPPSIDAFMIPVSQKEPIAQ